MELFFVAAISADKDDPKIVIDHELVLAKNKEEAKESFTIKHAEELKDVKDRRIIVAPFCG